MTTEASIKARLKQGLRPRRALASEGVYTALFTLLALTPALALLLFGSDGWKSRQELGLVPLLLSIAVAPLLGRALARQMVPGSGRTYAIWLLAAWFPLVAVAILLSGYYRLPLHFQAGPREQHCFLWGTTVALIIATISATLLLRGSILHVRETGAAMGLLAGMGGFVALETGCGLTGLLHLLTSHYTVPVTVVLLAIGLSPLLRGARSSA